MKECENRPCLSINKSKRKQFPILFSGRKSSTVQDIIVVAGCSCNVSKLEFASPHSLVLENSSDSMWHNLSVRNVTQAIDFRRWANWRLTNPRERISHCAERLQNVLRENGPNCARQVTQIQICDALVNRLPKFSKLNNFCQN